MPHRQDPHGLLIRLDPIEHDVRSNYESPERTIGPGEQSRSCPGIVDEDLSAVEDAIAEPGGGVWVPERDVVEDVGEPPEGVTGPMDEWHSTVPGEDLCSSLVLGDEIPSFTVSDALVDVSQEVEFIDECLIAGDIEEDGCGAAALSKHDRASRLLDLVDHGSGVSPEV